MSIVLGTTASEDAGAALAAIDPDGDGVQSLVIELAPNGTEPKLRTLAARG